MTFDELWTALQAADICCDVVRGGIVDASEAPSVGCDRLYVNGLVMAANSKGETVDDVVAICRLAVGDPQADPAVPRDETQLVAMLS